MAYYDDGLDVSPMNVLYTGETTDISVTAPQHCGRQYFLAASFGISQGIPLGTGVRFPLDYDPMLVTSLSTPSVFKSFHGQIPQSGTTTAQICIPLYPFLVGLDFYVAGVLDDFKTVSDPAAIHIAL